MSSNFTQFIGVSLYPFCVLSILCNIFLFFPGWSVEAINNPGEHMTPEVLYLGGFMGSGVLVLIAAIYNHCIGKPGKYSSRFMMFLSIIISALGVCGALYGLVVSALGLANGPRCLYLFISGRVQWTIPFKLPLEFLNLERSYLFNRKAWDRCVEPTGVVEFNVIFFSTILASSCIQIVLCSIQMLNGLFGCIFTPRLTKF
uniref:Transmembrane 4 L6 family member 4 n=1 Tax=Xenopus tropicalis TaxID=8364 RepID=A0A6I8RYM4_XENTR